MLSDSQYNVDIILHMKIEIDFYKATEIETKRNQYAIVSQLEVYPSNPEHWLIFAVSDMGSLAVKVPAAAFSNLVKMYVLDPATSHNKTNIRP